MKERRRYTRLATKGKTSLNKDGKDAEEGFLMDISPGGMRILLESQTRVGSVISGQFKIIPHIGPFYVKGEVAWINPLKDAQNNSNRFEVGVKFNKVSTIPI
ncbi:MAG: PilZ domain-containing protein [Candidatus Omnitrophica bacterium]|jgi:Tfp pilus assembly protein PilZ|nr:PilZ domain-containing protein [Candidatus Omnitrophota bacterium]MDD5079651.1 PilZ domain-containing protein [Candidatus Omnitrophota bacterium]